MCSSDLSVGLLLLRLTTGMLFFFQGYDKVYKVGLKQVVDTFKDPMQRTLIPGNFLKPLIGLSSYIEMFAGVFLALGVFRDISLYLLAADLAAVAIAFSSLKAMWDMQYFFPRFLFVFLLLMIPAEADSFTLSRLLPF